MDWVSVKQWIEQTPLHKDALHIYFAIAIQLLAALLLRRSLASFLPWGIVAFLELLNEAFDLLLEEALVVQPWQVAGAVHDVINTLLLPTTLLLLVRYVPALFQQQVQQKAAFLADDREEAEGEAKA